MTARYQAITEAARRVLSDDKGTVYVCACGRRFDYMTTLALHEIECKEVTK